MTRVFWVSSVIFLTALVSSASADLPKCTPDLPAGTQCKSKIKKLHPTQPEVGIDYVEKKEAKYEDLSKDKLKELKDEKEIPAVIGPDGELYIIDHHHTALALWRAGETKVHIKIVANWSKGYSSDSTPREKLKLFWKKMEDHGWAWTKLENGRTISPMSPSFPKSLNDVGNSDGRTLASMLIDKGVIPKLDIPFYEFWVALFLRKHGITVDGSYKDARKKAEEFFSDKKNREELTSYVHENCIVTHLKNFVGGD